jgi:predicted transposase/invertase (TIGR01784 family)
MTHYLDPKNDFVFKRIFGEHPDLLISFLNAIMPLDEDQLIESVEYLPPEMVPENLLKKNSIVDVRCKDNYGRQFIVEMQMEWNTAFYSRLLFNTSKAFVRQLDVKEHYKALQPVYGLGIINENFDHKTPEFYHHYEIVNRENTDEMIKGLEFVLIELEKFKPEKWAARKMAVLWLRFLQEMKDQCTHVSDDLLASPEIHRALDMCEEGAFTPNELAIYENYWDAIRYENAKLHVKHEEGKAEGFVEGKTEGLAEGEAIGKEKGKAEGLAEGEAIGKEKGEREKIVQIVRNGHQSGFSIADIATVTGLTPEEVNAILK